MRLEGRRKIAEGREAEIFEWDPNAVLKLYRNAGMGHEAEAAALAAISSAGAPAPQLLGRVEIDGRPGLLIERIAGADMLTLLEKAPWRIVIFARMLAESHAAIHRVPAPADLPDLTSLLEQRIRAAPLPTDLRTFALEHAASLPDGDRLCHGDFHPGNVLVTEAGASVIDWAMASRGHPAADYARSALLMSMGDPPPVSRFMRALVLVGRGLFSTVYERTYVRLASPDPDIVRRAQIAHVAARLSEGIDVEVSRLIRYLEKARAAR